MNLKKVINSLSSRNLYNNHSKAIKNLSLSKKLEVKSSKKYRQLLEELRKQIEYECTNKMGKLFQNLIMEKKKKFLTKTSSILLN
jgi:hypothetical protein